jgi:hypothetical protein
MRFNCCYSLQACKFHSPSLYAISRSIARIKCSRKARPDSPKEREREREQIRGIDTQNRENFATNLAVCARWKWAAVRELPQYRSEQQDRGPTGRRNASILIHV